MFKPGQRSTDGIIIVLRIPGKVPLRLTTSSQCTAAGNKQFITGTDVCCDVAGQLIC